MTDLAPDFYRVIIFFNLFLILQKANDHDKTPCVSAFHPDHFFYKLLLNITKTINAIQHFESKGDDICVVDNLRCARVKLLLSCCI